MAHAVVVKKCHYFSECAKMASRKFASKTHSQTGTEKNNSNVRISEIKQEAYANDDWNSGSTVNARQK